MKIPASPDLNTLGRTPLATSPSHRSAATAPAARSQRAALRAGVTFPALLLFASGTAALVYQVLWVKQLSLIVGVDVYAVTIGVSAFFAGLALGSYLVGRWADRVARPLLLYSGLELGIAALGVTATLALAGAAAPFAAMEAAAGPLAWAIPIVLVGLPAILMGGTLPVLIRALAPQPGQIGGSGGGLYAANTAGAIAGALFAPFALIPLFGVRGAALAGGIALGYEVVWSQAIVQFMSTRSFAFAVVLATYLAGLVVGAAIYARWADRVRDPWGVFGLLIAAAGLVALLEFAGLDRLAGGAANSG